MLRSILVCAALSTIALSAEAAPYPASCFPDNSLTRPTAPFPQHQSALVTIGDDISSYPYTVSVYRKACVGGGSAALVQFEALGTPAGKFPQMSVMQNGHSDANIRYARAPYANGEGVYQHFEPIGLESIVVLESESLDHDDAFSLVILGTVPVTINVPAYDASLYPEAQGPLPVASYVSGTYFDSATPGEGMQITVDPSGTIVVAWYTFTDAGEPLWLAGAGSTCPEVICIEPPRYSRVDLYAQRGGGFAGNFNPSSVQGTKWGSVRLQWNSCGELELQLRQTHDDPQLPDGEGTRNWIKLTSVAGVTCN